MRHSQELIANLIHMRKEGLTLSEIKNKTGLAKTTIHYYIQKVPKSELLIEKLKDIQILKNRGVADKRRGRSVKTYTFKKPEEWTPDFINLVAHFIFDGRMTKTSCTYFNRSQVLLDNVIVKMNYLMSVSDYKIYKTINGVKRVAYHHCEIAYFLRQKADELLVYIISALTDHQISFLKAFFDDEGCVTFEKKKRIVRGYQKSPDILKVVQGILKDFKIESKVDGKYFAIIIGKRNNLLKFQQLINFSPGLRVNGNRSNSIWKKDLEKREILKMATDSYRN